MLLLDLNKVTLLIIQENINRHRPLFYLTFFNYRGGGGIIALFATFAQLCSELQIKINRIISNYYEKILH